VRWSAFGWTHISAWHFQNGSDDATYANTTLVGVALNFTSFNPIQALFWSAVINGVVAVPVMVLMMLLTANTKVMGQFTVNGVLRFTGWLATAVMAAAVVGMFVTAVL
jgi:Mn2+/Fe2+ NRAMP family transporter